MNRPCFRPFWKYDFSCGSFIPFPCGNCHSCRLRKASEWRLRMILESRQYEIRPAFITLTYKAETLPIDYSVHSCELQNFFKRFRKQLDYKIRYFACGEYGTKRGRPHYHAIIFGLKQEDFPAVRNAWNKGMIEVEYIHSDKALAYVSGYVEKKIGSTLECEAYYGNRRAPFLLCSQGLGLKTFLESPLFTTTLKIGNYTYTVGRYLRNKLAEKFGILEQIKKQGILNLYNSVRALFESVGVLMPQYAENASVFRNVWQSAHAGDFNEVLRYCQTKRERDYS